MSDKDSNYSAKQAIEVYTKGTKCWFSDKEEGWVSASFISKEVSNENIKLEFKDDNNGKVHLFESTLTQITKTNGSDLPPLRNPPKMEYTDDLTNLSYLNEPSVLNTIRTRYMQHLIYTYSGIVLIAVNPFDRVSLYEPDIIQQYSGKRRGELEPHLFAIAEEAYRCMIREQLNQTIVVSGESGAGKTVSAKFIMRYFATADDKEMTDKKSKKSDGSMTEVEEQILATNPIMEAFGNAKTTRNDNSSRFGKYIEIQFDKSANIIGAKIKTYLLERSRLIFQPETERNYHIFYQLCAGVPSKEKKDFELGDYSNFHYLNQSGTGTIPGVNDAEEFEITQRALSTVGLSVDLQWKIFRVLAGLLHIGNFTITGRADAILSDSDESLITATRLLGIKSDEFRKWIVRKQILTRSEKIVTNLNPAQAHVVKDSVAKYIYSNLFDWLVSIINESLSCPDVNTVKNFIGVLDIYGFEHFTKNSFEQFCINYANEKLQQQFNQHVFKLEQEEYIKEQINWTFIEFSDNQKCIDLIERKLGILSLLDEESRLPSGTDQGFCQKLYDNFSTPKYKSVFKKPRFSNEAFIIAHYAHDVQYETENFLEKNRDSVPDEQLKILQNSEFQFLHEILSKSAETVEVGTPTDNKRKSAVPRKPTLGSIFKLSLIDLMDTIGNTNVHYIRCIKPNEAKVAWEFEPPMVLSQLRACGVLETIRISCLGYPSRWTFEEFADRYYALVPSRHWDSQSNMDVKELCKVILNGTEEDKYQIGQTKIFFRAGQLAHFEKMRSDRFDACATVLQKNIRKFVYRQRYLRTQRLVSDLQCMARQRLAKQALERLRQEKAATIIQTQYRRHKARQAYLAKKTFVLDLQCLIRARQARKAHLLVRENRAAVVIQKHVRGIIARKWYKHQLSQIVYIQSCVRQKNAKKQLIELRADARSANHFKEISYKLENKVVELTQTITSLKTENKVLLKKVNQFKNQAEHSGKEIKAIESRMASNSVSTSMFDALKSEKETIEKKYTNALGKIELLQQEMNQLKETLQAEKKKADTLEAKLKKKTSSSSDAELEKKEVADLKVQVAALKAQLAKAMHSRSTTRSPVPNRTMSPSGYTRRPSSRAQDEITEPQDITQPMRKASPLVNKNIRRNSAAAPSSPSLDQASEPDEPAHSKLRPISVGQSNTIAGGKSSRPESLENNPQDEMRTILRQEEVLQEEMLEGLIQSIKYPMPNIKNPPSRKEVLFPAHIIGLCVAEMWHAGYNRESENLLFSVMDGMQQLCLSYSGDVAIIPCAFWLTNMHELLSIVVESEIKMETEFNRKRREGFSFKEFQKLTQTVKYEIQCLEDNIYHAWMKEIKKLYSKMVIPAVIESQSLPGFITNDSGRFFNKLLLGNTGPAYSMDDLLNFLNKLHRTMSSYFIEFSIINQILSELLKMTGIMAFNDLLMRKNFASWKRAMQIQYNITRIEEWCKGHGIPEGALQLEHLMQATKLLQFKKATLEDIENIYDVCWILTPTQIQKLISQYHVADYESPIQPMILRAVANRVVSGDKADVLLLDSVPIEDTTTPFEIPGPREIKRHLYLPGWLNLKCVRRLIFLENELGDNKSFDQEVI